MNKITDKQFAALQGSVILYSALIDGRKTWVCRYCGAKTSILSEICDNCGREDINQGYKGGDENA